jgi:hypothetical protein
MGKKSKRRTAQTKVNNTTNVLTAELDTQLVRLTPREISVPRQWWQSKFESDNPRRQFWWQSMLELDLCDHGRPVRFIPESGHAVSMLIETVTYNCFDDLGYHQEVFDNDMYRKWAIDILVRIGIKACADDHEDGTKAAKSYALYIMHLESYNGEGDDILAAMFRSGMLLTLSDLQHGGEKDIIRFFMKRTTCSCLKERYKQIKISHPTSKSRCDNCHQVKDRRSIMLCGRCKTRQYCSIECQSVDWPKHKIDQCDKIIQCRREHVMVKE